ncbi:DUF2690 domain-containing protein [Streptomyces sp. NPDC047718]|uniref:DUF2690 domain-containing protein n=1 Tax=Streptomyces sp. NPDC047718 TaxID=3155479 RepID=UPI003407B855
MRNSLRRFATAGSVLALAASGLLLGTSPASAATSCLGSTCNGLDPATTVCQNDARTVATSVLGTELRYSPTCRAAWARYPGGTSFVHDIKVENTAGHSYSAHSNGNAVWTRMVNDKDIESRACAADRTARACSSWY